MLLLKNSTNIFIKHNHELTNLKNYYINKQFLINKYLSYSVLEGIHRYCKFNGKDFINIHLDGLYLFNLWKEIMENSCKIINLINEKSTYNN